MAPLPGPRGERRSRDRGLGARPGVERRRPGRRRRLLLRRPLRPRHRARPARRRPTGRRHRRRPGPRPRRHRPRTRGTRTALGPRRLVGRPRRPPRLAPRRAGPRPRRRPRLLEHLPLTRLPDRLGRALPSWPGLWDDRPRGRIVRRGSASRLPLLAVGGTHDPFAEDTVALWRGWGGPARLLLGPWGHCLTADRPTIAADRVNLGALYVRWARAALAGRLEQDQRGVITLDGSGRWHGMGRQAGETARTATWPFGARTGLRLLHGAEFTADPARPVRSDDLAVPADTTSADRCLLLSPRPCPARSTWPGPPPPGSTPPPTPPPPTGPYASPRSTRPAGRSRSRSASSGAPTRPVRPRRSPCPSAPWAAGCPPGRGSARRSPDTTSRPTPATRTPGRTR
ncbi:protein of unknown function [Streptomyces sp. KY70]|nr:protein of unknown function [Streptomyces sp. KY70]